MQALRALMEAEFPPPGWRWSLEDLVDGAEVATQRYGVVKSAGGSGGDVVRQPLFTLDFIGRKGGDRQETYKAAQRGIELLRESAGPVAIFEPGEATPTRSADGRPIYSVAVAATLIDD